MAITVSLLLLSGVVQLFANSKRSYQLQNDFGVLQENGRYATGVMTEGIRMVDHWGGVESGVITIGGGVAVTATGNCSQTWATDVNTAIQGYEGASTIGGTGFSNNCLTAGDYVPDSDILVLRYADSKVMIATANLASTSNPNNADTVFIRTLIGQGAEMMMGDDTPTIVDQTGLYNYPYAVEIYFLRPCSTKIGSVCQDTIPTLIRLKLNPGAGSSQFVQEVLAEYIEQMQFQYGSDTDANGSKDRYDNAGGVPNWGQVVSIRIALIAGGATRNNGYTDTGSYTLLDFTYTPAIADQKRSRQTYTRFIQIRNRTRS